MSRARLGLYVFCRKDLFKDCYELTPAFSQLLQRPDKLVLVQGEQYDDPSFNRSVKDSIPAEKCMEVADVAHMGMIASPANALGQFQQQQNEEAAPSDAVPESNDDAMDQDAPPAETAPSSSSDDDEE
jgi:intron-binding protein aquarius